MTAFIDHMIIVCFCAVAVGVVLGVPAYIMEKLDEKFNNKISDKIVNFFSEDEE